MGGDRPHKFYALVPADRSTPGAHDMLMWGRGQQQYMNGESMMKVHAHHNGTTGSH